MTLFLIYLVIVGLAICVLLGRLLLWWGYRTPKLKSKGLIRTAEKRVVKVGDRLGVDLHLLPKGLPSEQEDKQAPFRVCLLIDHSGSMGYGPGSDLREAVKAAQNFVHQVAGGSNQVGVIQFESFAEEVSFFSNRSGAIRRSIAGIGPGGGTCIDEGLLLAGDMFARARKNNEGVEYGEMIVLLSDGQSSHPAALAEAEKLKDQGLIIATIALGSGADRELMKGIASEERLALSTLDSKELTKLYDILAASLDEILGSGVIIRDRYAQARLGLSSTGEVNPVHINLQRGTVEWFLPYLNAHGSRLSYQVRPKKAGWYRLDSAPATMRMEDYKGNEHKFRSNKGPSVLVLPKWAGFKWLVWFLNPLFFLLLWKLFKGEPSRLPRPFEPPQPVAPPFQTNLVDMDADEGFMPSVRPSLVVGLGRAGGEVLTRLKKGIEDQFQFADPPPVRYLQVGHRPEPLDFAAVSLDPDKEQYGLAEGLDLSEITWKCQDDPGSYPALNWYPAEEIAKSYPDINQAHALDRRVARAALCLQATGLKDRLAEITEDLSRTAGPEGLDVLLVGSAAEAESSGLFWDTCCLAREVLKEASLSRTGLAGFLIPPTTLPDTMTLQKPQLNNTQAVLLESSRLLPSDRPTPLKIEYPEDLQLELAHTLDRLLLLGGPGQTHCNDRPLQAAATLQLWLESGSLRRHFEGLAEAERDLAREAGRGVTHCLDLASVQIPLAEIRSHLILTTLRNLVGGRLLNIEEGASEFYLPTRESVPEEVEAAYDLLTSSSKLSRPRPVFIANLPALADKDTFGESLEKLDELCYEAQSLVVQEEVFAQDLKVAASFIEEWCGVLLNGPPEIQAGGREAIVDARQGRLAVLLETLRRFEADCTRVENFAESFSVEDFQKVADFFSPDQFKEIFRIYRGFTARLRAEAEQWEGALVEGPRQEKDLLEKEEPRPRGLYRRINDLYVQSERNLKALGRMKGVEYLYDEELSDRIARLAPLGDELLARFRWFVELDDKGTSISLKLGWKGTEERVCSPAPDDMENLLESLLETLGVLTRPLKSTHIDDRSEEVYGRLPGCAAPDHQVWGSRARSQLLVWQEGGTLVDPGDTEVVDLTGNDPYKIALVKASCLQVLTHGSWSRALGERTDPSWRLPYVWPQERNLARLERYADGMRYLEAGLSNRLADLLVDLESMKIVGALVADKALAWRVRELEHCLCLNWQDRIFWLHREGLPAQSEQTILTGLVQLLVGRRDVYDSSKVIPLAAMGRDDDLMTRHSSADFKEGGSVERTLDDLGFSPDSMTARDLLVVWRVLFKLDEG